MMTRERRARIVLLALPLPLITLTYTAFTVGARFLGDDGGYVFGFAVYWACALAVPLMLWGRQGLVQVLAPARSRGRWERVLLGVILSVTLAGAVLGYFIPRVAAVALPILLLSPVAVITGVAEEALWRGSYVVAFGTRIWPALVLPTVAFALSHLSPLAIHPSESGTVSFLLATAFLGLAYGWVAFRTGTARWTAFAHALAGLLAFGEPLSSAVARLLGADV